MCRNLGALHVFAVSVRSGDEHWHNFSDFSLKVASFLVLQTGTK